MTSCLTSWTISCALSNNAMKLAPNFDCDGSSALSFSARVNEGRFSNRRVWAISKRMPSRWITLGHVSWREKGMQRDIGRRTRCG